MTRTIRYGEYLRNVSLVEHQISYNQLTPDIRLDTNGKIIPHVAPAVSLNSLDVFRLVKTHAQGRFMEQFRVVIPLAAYLIVFLIFILKQSVSAPLGMAFGLLGVIIGLMLFLEGLKLGLMPLGEAIGHTLPRKSTLPAVLTVAFILGVGVTFAEPAIGALQTAGPLSLRHPQRLVRCPGAGGGLRCWPGGHTGYPAFNLWLEPQAHDIPDPGTGPGIVPVCIVPA